MPDVLVVDDNQDLADVICAMLNILEISARPAYGARSGLLALEEKVPDLVFLDINMPGADGFEVLSNIHRTPGCEDLPVIMLTSDDQWENIKRAKEMGAATLIVKPVSLNLLETTLKDFGLLS